MWSDTARRNKGVSYLSDDLIEKRFGEPIYSYGDEQAVDDGVLVALRAGTRPTPYRVSRGAWEELKQYYKENGYPEYGDADLNRFFLVEILPLAPFAKRTYEQGGIMKLSYKFEVIERETREPVLWLMPNELNGLTLMRPSDY